MKIKKAILSLVLVASLLVLPTKVIAEPIKISADLPLEKQVELFTLVYGGNIELNKNIIEIESQWNPLAIGDSGRSKNLFQYQQETFYRHAKAFEKIYGEKLSYESTFDNIKLGVWAMNNGYEKEWTSYRCISNGGKYSFYSNQLKKHFTIYCKQYII